MGTLLFFTLIFAQLGSRRCCHPFLFLDAHLSSINRFLFDSHLIMLVTLSFLL